MGKFLGTLTLPSINGDAAAPNNGDLWYNTVRSKMRKKTRNVINDLPAGNNLVGDEYNKSSWTDLTDFTVNTMGATVSGGKIAIPDVNVADFTKSLQLAKYTSVAHWKMIIVFKRTANPTGSGNGISIGIQSTNTNSPCSTIVYFLGSGAMQFFYQSNSSTYGTSGAVSSALSYANNDLIELSIERENQTLTFIARNLTNAANGAVTVSMTLNLAGTDAIPANAGHWALWAQGGTFEIQSIQCINKEIYNPSVLFVGDSKILGYGSTIGYSSTVPGIISQYYEDVAVSAGFGDKSSDILNVLTQLTAMQPQTAVLAFGSNDQRFGVGGNFMTNYATIRAAFVAIGAAIVDVSPMYETGVGLDTQYSTFMAAYPSAIDVYNLVRQNGLFSDGIHLSDNSDAAVAKKIIDANAFYSKRTDNIIAKATAELTYTLTSSIAQTPSSAPANGTLIATYKWAQVLNLVTARFFFAWANAGTQITNVQFDLPSDMPAPESPLGFSAATSLVAVGSGGLSGAAVNEYQASRPSIHKNSSSSTGFSVSVTAGGTNMKVLELCFNYFTLEGI